MSSTIRSRFRCTEHFSPSRSRNRYDDRWFVEDAHADECGSTSKDFDVLFSTVLQKALESFPSIAIDADVICGTPRIAGTRIPVYMVLDAVRHYGALEGALKSYPQLTPDQVKEAISFAGAVLEQPVEYESAVTAG